MSLEIVKIHMDAEENGYPEINVTFRKPSLEEISILWSQINQDAFHATIKLLKTVFVTGDEWIFDDAVILSTIAEQLQDLLNGYPIKIDQTWNSTTLMMEYGITILVDASSETNPSFRIRRPNIDQLSTFQQYIESSPIVAVRDMYKACWIEGDESILQNTEYLTSAVSAIGQIMKRRTDAISKTWQPVA